MFASLDRAARSQVSQGAGLLALRISLAGLLYWWGLVKALNTGVGQRVSDKYYGGMFTEDTLLIGFGWVQIATAILLAVGLFRLPLLWLQFAINLFVAASVWQSIVDPFWLWLPGEKPDTVNALFVPSAAVAAACWVLIASRGQDTFALDRVFARRNHL